MPEDGSVLVDFNPMELAAFRFVGVLLPTIPIFIYTRQPVFPQGTRVILLMRCFMGTTGLMLSFYAFRHMPLADASVIGKGPGAAQSAHAQCKNFV